MNLPLCPKSFEPVQYTGRGSIIYAAPLLAAFIVLFLLMAERGFWIYCVGWGGGGQTGSGTFSSYFHPQLSQAQELSVIDV